MRKMSMIPATLFGAAILAAVPISLHQSQEKGLLASTGECIGGRIGVTTTVTITECSVPQCGEAVLA